MTINRVFIWWPAEAHKDRGAKTVYLSISDLDFSDRWRTDLSFSSHFVKVPPLEVYLLYCLQQKLKLNQASIHKLGIAISESRIEKIKEESIEFTETCRRKDGTIYYLDVKKSFAFASKRIEDNK